MNHSKVSQDHKRLRNIPISYTMKQQNHHTTGKSAKMRYTPPLIWIAAPLTLQPLLAVSGLETTVKNDDYAQYDGRTNNWDGFDGNESGGSPSLWDE